MVAAPGSSLQRRTMQKKTTPPAKTAPTAYKVEDPGELARNLLKLYEEGSKAMAGLLEGAEAEGGRFTAATEWKEAAKAMADVARHWLADPAKLAEAQGELMRGYA